MSILAVVHGRLENHPRWRELESRLKSRGQLTVHYSQFAGHSRELAREHLPHQGTVLSVGGDGTWNEVLNGWMERPDRGQPTFVLMPLGTGNDFARDREIPADLERVEKACFEPTVQPIDLGKLTFQHGAERSSRYFVVGATVGFSAEVTRFFQTLPRLFPGTVQYLFSLLISLMRWKNARATVESDSVDLSSTDFFNLNLANTRFYGGGMYSSPLARPDDGQLEFVLMELNKLQVIKALPQNYNGRFDEVAGVLQVSVKNLRLEAPLPLQVQADGEYLGTTPIEVEVIPGAFNLGL